MLLGDKAADPGNYRNRAADSELAEVVTTHQKLLAQNPRTSATPASAQNERTGKPKKKSPP